jgi:hypothetical protein
MERVVWSKFIRFRKVMGEKVYLGAVDLSDSLLARNNADTGRWNTAVG